MSKSAPHKKRPCDSKEARRLRFKRWFERNHDDINERRRERYKNDKAYKEAARLSMLKYRRKQAALRKAREGVFFRVSEVRQLLNITNAQLARLEKQEGAPTPIVSEKSRCRKYTAKMIFDLKQALERGIVR